MLTTAVTKIETERQNYKPGSLEFGISEILLKVIQQNKGSAETLANTDKTLKECKKHLWEIAENSKVGSGYYMPPDEAEIHIKSFYEIIDDTTDTKVNESSPINILDYL